MSDAQAQFSALKQTADPAAANLFENPLQIEKTFTGVLESGAGGEGGNQVRSRFEASAKRQFGKPEEWLRTWRIVTGRAAGLGRSSTYETNGRSKSSFSSARSAKAA